MNWRGRKCLSISISPRSLHFISLSPFPPSPHFIILPPFPLHFLILSPFPCSPAARLQHVVTAWWPRTEKLENHYGGMFFPVFTHMNDLEKVWKQKKYLAVGLLCCKFCPVLKGKHFWVAKMHSRGYQNIRIRTSLWTFL